MQLEKLVNGRGRRRDNKMALFKRNKTWWTDFSVNGQRYRLSLETQDWRKAQSLQNDKIADAREGNISPVTQRFSRLAFGEAAVRYLEDRRLELAPTSQKKEGQLLVRPINFFGSMTLQRISAENLLEFRDWRVRDGVGPAIINMELGVIRRILKRAKRWHLIGGDLRP